MRSSSVLGFFLVTCAVLFVAIACAGVDRHPCDWAPSSWAQVENPKDSVPADCNADAYPSPATSSTSGVPS